MIIDMTRHTPSPEEYAEGMRCKNSVQCGICGASADRYKHYFQCQKNLGHMAALNTGIFFDLTYPKENS